MTNEFTIRTWYIDRYNGDLTFTRLGTVEAKHHPDAMLKAFAKFGITDGEAQRKISARLKENVDRFEAGMAAAAKADRKRK